MQRWISTALLLLLLAGCQVPQQVSWSPDGKSAVYQGDLLDSNGKQAANLGPSAFDGVSAWSADSSALYFVGSNVMVPGDAITPSRVWLGEEDAAKVKRLPIGFPRTTIFCRRGGKTTPVATLWRMLVRSLAVSPDEHWLLITAWGVNGPLDARTELMALQLQSRRLYVVADDAAPSCFTANNRLAFVQSDRVEEVTLDDAQTPLQPRTLMTVLPDSTRAIAGSDSSLLLLTGQSTFPAPATQPTSDNIYAISRATGAFKQLAAADRWFMELSPDGKRILFYQNGGKSDQLAMIDVDGSHPRVLMDMDCFTSGIPINPSWHGNDRITFASATGKMVPVKDQKQQEELAYDVVDYMIPPDGPMRPAIILSGDWPVEMKPKAPIAGETLRAP